MKDRLFRWFVFHPFRLECEVNHHDGVLLHDADQKNDADQGHDAKIVLVKSSARMAPTPAEGSVERMVNG